MTTATKFTNEPYKPYRAWQLERKYKKPIDVLLAELLNEHGTQAEVAKKLNITQSTVSVWLKRFGVKVDKVASAPKVGAGSAGEVVEHASD